MKLFNHSFEQNFGINRTKELKNDHKKTWNDCKNSILDLIEQNKELESISYSGKECYKIYGTVIDKIKKEI